jgi:Ca-activated chloride channel family protein
MRAESRMQRIASLSVERAPISVAIVVDAGGRRNRVPGLAQEAVRDFVTGAHPGDELFLITAGRRPGAPLALDNATPGVFAQLHSTEEHDSAALLDSIHLAADTLRSARHARRAILVISDGAGTRGRYSRDEVLALLQDADLPLYALGLGGSGGAERASELLNGMTLATGGRYFEAGGPGELPEVMRQLDPRAQYLLGFWSPQLAGAGSSHPLQLRLVADTGSRKLRVYWRPDDFPATSQAAAVSVSRALSAPPRKTMRF